MSSERTQTSKQSRGKRVKTWAKSRWNGFRSGSPSSATPSPAPSAPQSGNAPDSTSLGPQVVTDPVQASSNMQPTPEDDPTSLPDAEPVVPEEHTPPAASRLDVVKDYLNVTSSFLQLVLKKVPDAVDTNPVKVVFSLAKAVVELKEGMDDNLHAVEQRIVTISELLGTVEKALQETGTDSSEEKSAVEEFTTRVNMQLARLVQIKRQTRLRSFALQEDDKKTIVEIFDAVEDARNLLMVATNLRILDIVEKLRSEFDRSLPRDLKASPKADHLYSPDADEDSLRRNSCTPGTRVDICGAVNLWAVSPDSESVYWLSGQGGAGKTTIARTIAERFKSIVTTDQGSAVLGGSFFCSHSSRETRKAAAIVRTIVSKLAALSNAFKAALKECGNFDAVEHGPMSQLEGLLVGPWKKSALGRLAENKSCSYLCYVIPIDALDELEGDGSIEFLGALFEVVNKHNLTGLKFFITSRSEPELVKQIQGFENKQVCRLEEVSVEESSADIEVYLREKLGEFATDEDIRQLVADAAGLFIYASTAVEYVRGSRRTLKEQKGHLKQLLALSRSATSRPSRGATAGLDKLYLHVLETSLVDPGHCEDPDVMDRCLSILHTFLCTVERTSTSVAADILGRANSDDDDDYILDNVDPDAILNRLHAVIQVKDGQVVWFHRSFPDFIFDKSRSRKFFCDQEQHHRLLFEGCFRVMNLQLRFNIANIPSSSKFDRDHPSLSPSVQSNISPALRYACQSWISHLVVTSNADSEPFLVVLRNFLQLRILFWIEIMNLLHQQGRCENMLRDAQKWMTGSKRTGYKGMLHDARQWVPPSKELNGLATSLYEASAFAGYFSGQDAVLSTPHLYLSSLATYPQQSDLIQGWRRQFRGIPTFTHTCRNSWPELRSVPTKFLSQPSATRIAVSSDGRYAVYSHQLDGDRRLVRICDLSTLEELSSFRCLVKALAFAPDGAHLALSETFGGVEIWDTCTGEKIKGLKGLRGLKGVVTSLAYSPDGTCVIGGSEEGLVRLWNASTGAVLKVFGAGHRNSVLCATYSLDGELIIAGCKDGSIRLWNTATAQEVMTFHGHNYAVSSIALSPNNTHLASVAGTSAKIWDVSTGEELRVIKRRENHRMLSVAYSTDGKSIAIGSSEGKVRIWDPSTGERLRVFKARAEVNAVAYLPDGTSLLSSSSYLQLWDLSTCNTETARDGHTADVKSVACSPDGNRAVSGSSDNTVRLWDLATGAELKVLNGHSDMVTSVKFSPSGACIVSGSRDYTIRIWDASTGGTLKVLNGHTGQVWSVAYLPDGKHIVSGSGDKTVRLWDTSTGEEVQVFNGHMKDVDVVAPSPDGTLVASASSDLSVRVWDLATGQVVKVLKGPGHFSVNAMAFSPDGTRLATASGKACIWDLSTGEVLTSFSSGVHRCVAFSPDGAHIITDSSKYRAFGVWDASTGIELPSPKFGVAHCGMNSIAYSPNGAAVLSASGETVRLWKTTIDTPSVCYVREVGAHRGATGWLVSPTDPSSYMMFVPRPWDLPEEGTTLVMPKWRVSHVDFSKAKLGKDWARCYTPTLR